MHSALDRSSCPTSIRRHRLDDQPGTRIKPSWLPANLGENATVVLTPGTADYDGSDQLKRTRDIGFYDSADPDDPAYYNPTIIIIGADEGYDNYPAAFGFTVLGLPVNLAGRVTNNESVDIGTADAVKAATDAYQANPNQTIILNGYSQSGPVSMNAAYLIHRDSLIPDDNVIVVIGADSRFPNTGVENVGPKLYPGHIHHDETAEWTVGNTTYVVLDGGNPWGMMLRDLGLPVPTEFDTALSTVVPVPMPGQQAAVAGQPVPTPRDCRSGSISDSAGMFRSPIPTSWTSKTISQPCSSQAPYRIASRRRSRRQRSNPPIPRPPNPSTQTRMRRACSRRRPRTRPLEPVATTPTPHQRRMAKLQETQVRRPPGSLPRTTRHRRGRNIARQRR